jgi:hypothetical protein
MPRVMKRDWRDEKSPPHRTYTIVNDAEPVTSPPEEPASDSPPASDNAAIMGMLKRILVILESSVPTGGAPQVTDREQPPAKRPRTHAWDTHNRSPSTKLESGHRGWHGQKPIDMHRPRVQRCYRCGSVHFPYCSKRSNRDRGNREFTPAKGGDSWSRGVRGKSMQY